MVRKLCFAVMLLAGLTAGTGSAADPVFDDQAMHPQLLPRGSMEYDHALKRRERASTEKPSADAQQIGEAMAGCDAIAPLSQATREKCEIRARQRAPSKKLR